MGLGIHSSIKKISHEKFCLYFTVGWGSDQRGFGEQPGMKTQIMNLIRSIRTVMRSKLLYDKLMI